MEVCRLQSLGIKNTELDKLRDSVIAGSESLINTAEQIVSYYEFKMKDELEARSIHTALFSNIVKHCMSSHIC
jgi:hypothetical protein